MKRINIYVSALLVMLCVSGCTVIGPGHVGVKVNNLGTDRGVQGYVATTGLVFFCPGLSSIYEYSTAVETAAWTQSAEEGSPTNEEITFNTKEGTAVSSDISLSIQIDPAKVPAFYVKFRSDDVDSFLHGYMRNVARDAFNEEGAKYSLEEVYGPGKAQLIDAVKKRIEAEVTPYGVRLQQFGFIGKMRMDPAIAAALNTKLVTTQNAIAAENRKREAEANATNVVVTAHGEAQANIELAKSVTPELIKWKELDIQKAAIARWNGKSPTVMGGGNMLFNIPLNQ